MAATTIHNPDIWKLSSDFICHQIAVIYSLWKWFLFLPGIYPQHCYLLQAVLLLPPFPYPSLILGGSTSHVCCAVTIPHKPLDVLQPESISGACGVSIIYMQFQPCLEKWHQSRGSTAANPSPNPRLCLCPSHMHHPLPAWDNHCLLIVSPS